MSPLQCSGAGPCLGWDPRLLMCFPLPEPAEQDPVRDPHSLPPCGQQTSEQRGAAHTKVPPTSKPLTHGSSTAYAAATSAPPPCPWAVRKAQWAAPLPRAFGKLAARTPVKSTQCWRVAGDIKSEARCPTRSVSQEWAGWWGSELSTTDMQGWEYHC